MDERWARLKTIFHDALEQPPETRRRWLASACAGDDDLRRDVESLLTAHDTAGGFLEEPPVLDPLELSNAILLPAGARLGKYRIVEELGRGGMGVVYLAEDERLGRRVALKSLSPDIAADPASHERLRREARAAATVSHAAIAVVYALEEIDDQLFIATEYVPGRTLRTELGNGPLAPDRATAIAIEVAGALSAAHAAGVVHRDLKPENVLITDEGNVKVVDFGIAHLAGSDAMRLTIAGAFLGTPAYMAPEQLAGGPTDARVDIYSLGLLLGEMLCGDLKRGDASPIAVPTLRTIVERCTEPDPSRRYGSARELLADLQTARRELRGEQQHARQRPSVSLWWWQFHQGVVALSYGLMLIPAWGARGAIGGRVAFALFIVAVGAAVATAALRLHLWFTSRLYPAELGWLHARTRPWLRAADIIFVVMLTALGFLLGDRRSALATLLIGFSIGAAVGFLVIEPATAKAAFGRRTSTV